MIVGTLTVILGLDSTGFNTGISTATGKTTAFAKASDKAFKLVAKSAKIAMIAIGAAFVKGAIDAAKFEKALADVSTMLDKTTLPLMKEFEEGILALSETYGASTDALAKGLYDILSASIPAAEAMDVLEQSAIAARAGLTDTGVAADAITTLMNSFGDATKDASFYSDILFATVKFGKCLTGDTRVLLSNGEYKRIDSLSGDVSVVSWDYKTFTPTDAKFIDMGTKQTVEIETRNGRIVTTTPEHPYLTVNGWKKVSDLKEGDKIAVPTSLPFFGNVVPEAGFPELLGLLLAEGSMNGSTPKLTIGNEHTDKLAREATAKYGIGYVKINQTNDRCPQYCLSDKKGSDRENKLTKKLRSMGIWGDTCYTKKIPEEVFTWKKEYIAKFLNAYFTGDGWLCTSGPNLKTWALGVCSVSRELLNDVSHLLLRFGINGTIRKTSNNAYVWEAHRFIEIRRFMDFIGIQRDGLEVFNAYIPTRSPNQYNCLANGGVRTSEYSEYKRYRGIKSEGNLLEYVAIKRIEYKKVERVYDLMVPVLHNFVANDILAHNTTFSELAGPIGQVAKLMAVAGGTAEEMAAMLSIMTRNGLKTKVAITSLRGVVSALLKPSEALTAELGGMTVKADGFRAVMDKIGSLPATDLAKMFPNVRALTGIVVAAKGLGAEVDKIQALMKDGSPTMVAFEKNTQTVAFVWDQFKATLKATSITIGNELLPTVREILEATTKWFKDNREELANFAYNTIFYIKEIIGVISRFKEVIISLGTGLSGLMIMSKVSALMKTFGIATSVSAGPVFAIAAAIGLLVAAFFSIRKAMRDAAEEEKFLNDAMKGNLSTVEEYNDAADIQRKKILELTEERDNATVALKNAGLQNSEYAQEQSKFAQEVLDNEKEKLAAIRDNGLAIEKRYNREESLAKKKAAQELADYYAEAKRISDSAMAEAEKEAALAILDAKRIAREKEAAEEEQRLIDEKIKVNEELDKKLWQINASESDRVKRRVKELQVLGRTYEEILQLIADEFPEAYKAIVKANENAQGKLQGDSSETVEELLKNLEEQETATLAYEEGARKARGTTSGFLRKLAREDADAQIEASQTFTDYIKENALELMSLLVSTAGSVVNSIITIFSNAAQEEITAVTEKYAILTQAEEDYQAFLDAEKAKDKKDQIDKLAQLKKDLAAETDAVKKAAIAEQILDLETAMEKTRLAEEAEQARVDAEEKAAAEILKIKKDTWKKEKDLRLAMAWIDMAAAIVRALVDPGDWAGVVLSAAAAVTGAAQIAAINSQKMPMIRGGLVDKMIDGGVVRGNPGIDTNNVALTNREYIMPPQQAIDNLDELEAMRSGGGGKAITVNPMPLLIEIEGQTVFDSVIEFFTEASDRGEYRLNPKILGEVT